MELPPRKWSVTDDDFDPMVARRIRFTLDGEEVTEVTEYDCDAGTITRLKRNEAGELFLINDKTEIAEETLTGAVMAAWKA